MNIFLKTEDEIELMRSANLLVGATLAEVGRHIRPGISTRELDAVADEFIRDHGAVPTFKGFPNPYGSPFPNSICTSVNDVVVHGIPDAATVLKEGEVSEEVKKLLQTTKQALYLGIKAAVAGGHVGDISCAVQDHCASHGYGIVRELTGHGIGKDMHEDPQVPNYGNRGRGPLLKSGMCIAIEPMITMGKSNIYMMPDRWTIRTRDHMPAAHFEHTIAIRKGEADILSSFEEIEKLEGQNI